MTKVAQMQERTITISAPVSTAFDKRLRLAVVERDLPSKAAAIRQALEQWLEAAPCPQCGRMTGPHPDALMEGVRYCFHCEEAVLLSGNDGQGEALAVQ
jgi:predicted nucleic acid-binding Zn ribbon protein